MNKLFEIKTTINYHEYRKFFDAIYSGLIITRKQQYVLIIGMSTTMLPLFYFDLAWLAILLLIMSIFIPLLIDYEIEKTIKKSYDTNKLLQDVECKYIFNEENIKIKELKSNSVIAYDHLYSVIETDTNYYLLISNSSGFIIAKKDIDHKKDFKDFIKEKAKDIYKNKCKKKH